MKWVKCRCVTWIFFFLSVFYYFLYSFFFLCYKRNSSVFRDTSHYIVWIGTKTVLKKCKASSAPWCFHSPKTKCIYSQLDILSYVKDCIKQHPTQSQFDIFFRGFILNNNMLESFNQILYVPVLLWLSQENNQLQLVVSILLLQAICPLATAGQNRGVPHLQCMLIQEKDSEYLSWLYRLKDTYWGKTKWYFLILPLHF